MQKALAAGALTLLVGASVGFAQSGPEQCSAALTITGRNELLKISQSDRRAYFYRLVCKGQSQDASLSFQKAQIALGVSYSSRDQYCSSESQKFENYDFDFMASSMVVEKALDSWLACQQLWKNGIILRPQVEPTRLILSLERGGKGAGKIRGVSATAGTVCRGFIGKSTKTLTDSINFTLPVDEAWTITCERKSIPSTTVVGAVVYPVTTVTLDTTEGGFSITLDESPQGPEKWATEVQAGISSIEQSLGGLKTFAETRAPADLLKQESCSDHTWGDCRAEGWVICPVGKYLAGVYNAGGDNACVRWIRCCNVAK